MSRARERAAAQREANRFDAGRGDGDADRARHLLGDAGETGGAAHARLVDVGVAERVERGEFERAEEAAASSAASSSQCGVVGGEQAVARRGTAPRSTPLTISTRRKPKRLRIARGRDFIAIAPAAATKVSDARFEGVRPKPICSSSGSRKGIAPMPMRNRKPPTTPAKKVGMLSRAEVDDRVRIAPRVARHRRRAATTPPSDQRRDRRPAARRRGR